MASPSPTLRVLLAVLSLGYSLEAQAPEAGRGAEGAGSASPQTTIEGLQGKLCEARLRRVESVRSAMAEAPPAAPAPLPEVPALIDALVRRDGKALHSLCEPLLVRGPEGYAVLHAFFHRADIEHAKILTLTHDPQLLYALLRLTAVHPEKVADLSRYLMRVTRDRPESFIRREIYNFVPVFLKHHEGCFPELWKELEDDIAFQIENGAEYFNKVVFAMRELRFEPPDATYLKFLENPRGQSAHPTMIAYLAARGPDGLRILARHVQESTDAASPTVRQALRSIGEKESRDPPEILAPFLVDPRPEVRRAAREGYFSRPRETQAAPRALEYLDAEDDPRARAILLGLIRRHSPEMIAALKERAEEARDPKLKEALLAERAPAARRKSGRGGAPETSGGAPAPGGADLPSRIAQLEEQLRAEASSPPAVKTAPSPSGVARTHDAARASNSQPGSGDRAGVAELLGLFERRDAPALAASLERWLAKGDSAHETLRDFLLEVDRKPIEEHAAVRSYQVSFAIVHPVLLHELEAARFVHYFLEATRDRQGSAARAMILEFAPVLVRYHHWTFPDLRGYLERMVLDGLVAGGENLPQVYMIMETLGFVPPIGLIEDLLAKARSIAEVNPLIDHLRARNDRDAVRTVTRILIQESRFQEPKAAALLAALARMTIPEAESALLAYMSSGNAQKRDPAALAYFAVERGDPAVTLAVEYLNSPSGVKEKTQWILRMRQLNPGLVESIRARADQVKFEVVRAALQETSSPRPDPQIR